MRDKNKIEIWLCIASILLIILLACGNPRETKVVFVLFDLSESTINNRGYYYEDFVDKILPCINPGDSIVAATITDRPLMMESFLINEDFERFSTFKHSRGLFEQYVKNKKEKIKKKARELLIDNEMMSPLTDILGAMQNVPDVFNTYKGKNKKILIVMSDMVHDHTNYDFERENPTEQRILEIIFEEKARRLPSLKEVEIYVNGASDQNTGIRNFWERYFDSCGAILKYYGPRLLQFMSATDC